jgi:hypothetical protein
VIGTEAFTITELGNGVTKISGLHVTDADATASTDTFTVSAATGNVGSSVSPSAGSGAGMAGLNAALDNGIVYDAHSPQPQTDSVTLTVADSFGHPTGFTSFFNQGGSGPDVTLTGNVRQGRHFRDRPCRHVDRRCERRSVRFCAGESPSADTITDFTPGQDRIDLRLFSEVGADNINGWLSTHAVQTKPDGCPDHARQRSYHAEERHCHQSACQRLHRIAASRYLVAACEFTLAPRDRCYLLTCPAPLAG